MTIKNTHNLFSVITLVVAILLWWVQSIVHSNDVGMICKMIANQAMMLTTISVFGNLYISRSPDNEVWSKILSHPVAIAILLGSIGLGSAVCAVGTLVIFGNG